MKAIVLTYDGWHKVTDFMITCYKDLWPTHPFIFRVPYQNYPKWLKDKHTDCIELVQTPKPFKNTVLTLLDDLDDNTWVYWTWDDRWPIKINTAMYEMIMSDMPECDGLLLIKDPKWGKWKADKTDKIHVGETEFVRRKTYSQLAQHQFIKVKVLRDIFGAFPDQIGESHDMDALKSALKMKHRLYVCESDMVFAESGMKGKLYKNTVEAMKEKDIDVSGFDVNPGHRIMGKGVWDKWL